MSFNIKVYSLHGDTASRSYKEKYQEISEIFAIQKYMDLCKTKLSAKEKCKITFEQRVNKNLIAISTFKVK